MMDETEMPERPPTFDSMFINSTDTLQGRQIDQEMSAFPEWNVKPPLFTQFRPKRQRFWQAPVDNDDSVHYEEPTLLKGVSKSFYYFLTCTTKNSNVIVDFLPDR